jgi:hypothetical protein
MGRPTLYHRCRFGLIQIIIAAEGAATPTVCLRFRFPERLKVHYLLEACVATQRQAVDFALNHHRIAALTIIEALHSSLRAQCPDLPSAWLPSAVRSFRNCQRRGKTLPQKPEIRRPFLCVQEDRLRCSTDPPCWALEIGWDGETLTRTFPLSSHDPEPIVLSFRLHHKYRRLLDEWKAGEARMGEPTPTAHSFSILLRFPDAVPY